MGDCVGTELPHKDSAFTVLLQPCAYERPDTPTRENAGTKKPGYSPGLEQIILADHFPSMNRCLANATSSSRLRRMISFASARVTQSPYSGFVQLSAAPINRS